MLGRSMRKWALVMALGVGALAVEALGAAPAMAASGLGPVHAVIKQSPSDHRAAKTFSASCNPGERVLGGGALTVGGVHAVITEMRPIHTPTVDSFEVSAAADQFGISVAWSFQVFAFCATAPAPLDVEIVSHTNPPTSGGTDQAGVDCPGGKYLIGAGGKIDNGNGQVDLGMFTGSSGPFVFRSAAFAKEDADGYSGNYTVTGYSVCARGTFGDFQQVKTQVSTSMPSQTSSVACPSGMRLTGVAGGTVLPGTHLQDITSLLANSPVRAHFGAQASVLPSEPWSMEMTVFCAN
jgi:hypothetical protein